MILYEKHDMVLKYEKYLAIRGAPDSNLPDNFWPDTKPDTGYPVENA